MKNSRGVGRNVGAQPSAQVVRLVDGHEYERSVRYGLVTLSEAAHLLGVTSRTMWNLVARGSLRPRWRGSRVLFPLSSIRSLPHFQREEKRPWRIPVSGK